MTVKTLVDASAAPLITYWKERVLQLPEPHEEDLTWEEQWMNAVMSKVALATPRLGTLALPTQFMIQPQQGLRIPEVEREAFEPVLASASDEAVTYPFDSEGHYQVPTPRIGTGATKRQKFVFPATNPSSTSSSSTFMNPAVLVSPPQVVREKTVGVFRSQLSSSQIEMDLD